MAHDPEFGEETAESEAIRAAGWKIAAALTTNGAAAPGGAVPGLGELISDALSGGVWTQGSSVSAALDNIAEAINRLAEAVEQS